MVKYQEYRTVALTPLKSSQEPLIIFVTTMSQEQPTGRPSTGIGEQRLGYARLSHPIGAHCSPVLAPTGTLRLPLRAQPLHGGDGDQEPCSRSSIPLGLQLPSGYEVAHSPLIYSEHSRSFLGIHVASSFLENHNVVSRSSLR
jgi:hypothetical protein